MLPLSDYKALPSARVSSRKLTLRQWIGVVAVFVAIIATFAYVENAFRNPHLLIAEKMRFLASTDEQYDAVFLGTSVTLNAVDTPLINRSTSQCHLNTYNGGLVVDKGLWATMQMLEAIKANPHPHPLYIIIDPALVFYTRLYFDRYRYMQTTEGTWIYRGVGQLPSALQLQLIANAQDLALHPDSDPLYARFLYRYATNTLRTGALASWLMDVYVKSHITDQPSSYLAKADSGFHALDTLPLNPEHGWEFVEDPGRYFSGSETADRMAFDLIVQAIRDAGSQAVILFAPAKTYPFTLLSGEEAAALRRWFPTVPILSYNAIAYPSLTNPLLWYDHHHLNGYGASVLSRYIYADLCRLVERR